MEQKSNSAHVTVVQGGNIAIKNWRRMHPGECLNLRGYKFTKLKLTSAEFASSFLEAATFEDCDLSNADFSNANLTFAKFVHCRLSNANFEGASLRKTDFDDVNMDGAVFGSNPTISRIGMLNIKCEEGVFPKYNNTNIPVWDSFISWENLRFMNSINIFVPSYVALILSVLYLNGLSAYNIVVDKMNSIIAKAPGFVDVQSMELVQPGVMHIWVLIAFLLLSLASTVFLFCPSRITDISREEWENRLRQPMLIYDHSSWRTRWLRILCSILLASGGLIASVLLSIAIWRQVKFILIHAPKMGVV